MQFLRYSSAFFNRKKHFQLFNEINANSKNTFVTKEDVAFDKLFLVKIYCFEAVEFQKIRDHCVQKIELV